MNFGKSIKERCVQVFLRGSRNSMVVFFYYVLGMHLLYESGGMIGYCNCWVVGEWFVCTVVLQVIVDFCEMPPPLSHGLMTLDWLFLRLFNAIFFFNVRSV